MEIFGPRWKDHWSRIQEDWNSRVTADDTVLIAGDTSWAMHLKDAQEDLDEIRALPGRKLIIRGNHDFWWESAGKLNRMDAENNMQYLYGTTVTLDEGGSAPATSTTRKSGTPSPTAASSCASSGPCRKQKSSAASTPSCSSTTRRSAT